MKKTRKKRPRYVLGVGYPCFGGQRVKGVLPYTTVALTTKKHLRGDRVRLIARVGGWRKCRLILEPL